MQATIYGVLCLTFMVTAAPSVQEYMAIRNQAFEDEQIRMLGGSTTLSDSREVAVNQILMKFKNQEYTEGLDSNGAFFAGSNHFFHSRDLIEGSNIYKIIRLLPKGAALHMHDVTVGPTEFTAYNITTWDNLYYCVGDDQHLLFRFFQSQPSTGCTPTSKNWASVRQLRDEASSQNWIDNWFHQSMTMMTPTPEVAYPDTNTAWKIFERNIDTISGIVNYDLALREYYYNVLKYHYDDNVMYIEMRGLLSDVYRLNQSVLTSFETLKIYDEVTKKFLVDYPDFWGAKYIYAPHRFHSPTVIGQMIDDAAVMKQNYPSFFAGFDLVGQENVGPPLLDFLPQLLTAADKGVKFFFHAGETDWHGTKIDENLMDAVLLNTTRFGHGYALQSHPLLYDIAKERGIAVEMCPISNQVLRLVEDLRNHPGSNYLRDGFPVVIAGDGPGMYGAAALSHDWYLAFMALAGERADLRFLKQLALNSIQYSAMSAQEKMLAYTQWEVRWSRFLDKVLEQYSFLRDAESDKISAAVLHASRIKIKYKNE